jgi:hypothetical protein
MQVKFSWVQSRRWKEQCSGGMLLFSTEYPDQVSLSYFSCKAALLSLALPWLGPCLSAKRPLTELCSASVSHILVHSFSDFSPWLFDPVTFRSIVRQYMLMGVHGGENLLTSWQPGNRER